MDNGNSRVKGFLRIVKSGKNVVNDYVASVGLKVAGQNIHERTFSCAILATKTVYLARSKGYCYIIKRFYAWELFGDILEF
jgi:hypothetical protein